MRKLLFTLLISVALFGKELPEGYDRATLRREPSSFIEGCVSAITESLSFQQDDLVVRGASPITLRRRYVSLESKDPSLIWHLFSHTLVEIIPPATQGDILFLDTREPGGTPMRYILHGAKGHPIEGAFSTGSTNTGMDYLGGQYHPLESVAEWLRDGKVTINLSNGGRRLYKFTETKPIVYRSTSENGLASKQKREKNVYHLIEEHLANGQVLCFTWQENAPEQLEKVELKNPDQSQVLSSIILTEAPSEEKEKQEIKDIKCTTSDQREIRYTHRKFKTPGGLKAFNTDKFRYLITQVKGGEYPNEFLKYSSKNLHVKERGLTPFQKVKYEYDNDRVSKIIAPFDRTINIEYKKKDEHK